MNEASIPAPAAARGWRGVVRGFGILAGGETLARLLGFAAIVVMTRRLGPEGFGVVAVGTTLVAWTALVVDAGTEQRAVRDLSRAPERARSLAEPLLGLRIALALVLGACLAGGALGFGAGGDSEALALFALALPAVALNPRFMAVALRASGGVAAGNVLGQIVLLVGVIVLVGSGDVRTVPILVAAGEALYAAVVLAFLVPRVGALRPRVDVRGWWENLLAGRALLGTNAARAVVYSADLLLIALLLGDADAGHYGAAYKPVLFVSGAMGLFYVNFLAAHQEGTAEDRSGLATRALRTTPVVAGAVALAITLSAPFVTTLVFGDGFAPAAAAMAVLAWTLPLQAANGVYANLLISAGRERVLLRSNGWGAAGNVLANLAVIPLLGIAGAAAVTVLTEAGIVAANRRAARS